MAEKNIQTGNVYKQSVHRIKRGDVMANIRIITKDGKVYTDPKEVHIPRNEKYEMLYRIVENYKPVEKKEGTA